MALIGGTHPDRRKKIKRIIHNSKAGEILQNHYLFKGKDGGHDEEMYNAEVEDLAENITLEMEIDQAEKKTNSGEYNGKQSQKECNARKSKNKQH